jgi:protein O-GlcNAc transferase
MSPKQAPTILKTDPSSATVNALLALYNGHRYTEAESQTRALLRQYPNFGFGWKLLGNILQRQGKDALSVLQKIVEFMPDDAEAHYNLGVALKHLGLMESAVASYRRAVKIKPAYVDAHYNLGNALKELKQFTDAVASYRRALKIKPDSAYAHNNLGTVFTSLGQLNEAIASYRRAVAFKPDFTLAHYNLGNALKDLGQLPDAVMSYHTALKFQSDFVEAHNNLAGALKDLGQWDSALASCRRALELKPDLAEAHINLGQTLQELGRLTEAVASLHRGLELKPDSAEAHSNLLFLYGYHALVDPDEYLAQARHWEEACIPVQEHQAARNRSFQRRPLAGRRLKVGYVSGDYRQHAVSYFIEQLFAHHDKARIELFAYSTHGQHDAVTVRLHALAEHWVSLVGISDVAARERIEADGIDVLIDLSGHTGHNRLGIFARRAAPVQAYYLGYFASTGLTEMDYWIGDEVLSPPETDNHFSEQVWRLPRISWSYHAKAAPAPGWHPDPDGTVWIGSFNNLGKLTPETLVLWAKVLHALPEGKLLLKTKELSDHGNRQRILDTMADHGITSQRIELQDRSATPDWSAHMAYYDRLDIALDPISAMGGVTTTFDALWMAVPVITLQGDRAASRATAAIVGALGHTEWIAGVEEEYIDKVVTLARNAEQRISLRASQRNRMASSPLCDARGLAISLENAYFEMFEQLRLTGKRLK